VKFAGPIVLASRSPRRRQMLMEAGIDVTVNPPDLDDGVLRSGCVRPEAWVMALAYLKARRVAAMLRNEQDCWGAGRPDDSLWSAMRGTVLGADTVCVAASQVLGQPRDAADARRMLELLRDSQHVTLTGVCLLTPSVGRRAWLWDAATVHVGDLSPDQIDSYLASGDWRGKAGAYNLSERIESGWPVTCDGDPTTVMGLPMRKLTAILARGAGS
jgi:septum formation protein